MDRRIRDLARRAQEGDPESGAALLRERVRAGELSQSALLLMAWLGDPPAIAATGRRPPDDTARWVDGLAAWGWPVPVRACLALASAVWRREVGEPRHPSLAEVEALLERHPPGVRRRTPPDVLALLTSLRARPEDEGPGWPAVALEAAQVAVLAAHCGFNGLGNALVAHLRDLLSRPAETSDDDPGGAVAAAGLDLASAKEELCAALLPLLEGRGAAALLSQAAPPEVLERAFVDPRREARALRRGASAGGWDRERLRVAAFLGDPGARLALGTGAPPAPGTGLLRWLERLGTLDPAAREVAVGAIARRIGVEGLAPSAIEVARLARRSGQRMQDLLALARSETLAWALASRPASETSERAARWRGSATPEQLARIRGLAEEACLEPGDLAALLDRVACKDSLEELEKEEVGPVLDRLRAACARTLAARLGLSDAQLRAMLAAHVAPDLTSLDEAVEHPFLAQRLSGLLDRLRGMLERPVGLIPEGRPRATPKQLAFIASLVHQAKLDADGLQALLRRRRVTSLEELTRAQASRLIEQLKGKAR